MPGQLKSVSFTSPYDAEAQEIERRRALAAALQQQAAQPLPTNRMAGRVAIPIHPLEGAAQLAKGLSGAYGQKQAGEEQKALSERVQNERRTAWAAALKAAEGTQATPISEDAAGNISPPQPAVQGGGLKALAASLSQSSDPMLQHMGMQQQMSQFAPPQRVDLGDRIGLINAQGQLTGFLPKGATPDATLREQGAQQRHVTPSGSAQLGSQTTLATSVLNPEVVSAKGQIAAQGATRVQTNVNAFTPASEEAQRKFMDSTRATFDQLKHAPVLLANIEKAKALIPSARGFMGTGGEPLLEAAKFLNNRLGTNIAVEGVKSAEELRTRIFFNIMDNLKKMDAQPSQLQQQIMMESLGKLGTDPNALPAVLDAFAEVIKGKVQLHNQEVTGATQRGVRFPYDPTIGQKAVPGVALSKEEQKELEELRKRFGR